MRRLWKPWMGQGLKVGLLLVGVFLMGHGAHMSFARGAWPSVWY
jgi:hypothetical protein